MPDYDDLTVRLLRVVAESDGSFKVPVQIGHDGISYQSPKIVHVETTPIDFGDDRTARAIWVVAP